MQQLHRDLSRPLPATITRRGVRLRTGIVILYLSIQCAVPLWQLQAPRPGRFGWQMYSALNLPRQYDIVRADGRRKPVDLQRYVAHLRAESDLAAVLPPIICAREAEAVEVRFRVLPEVAERSVRCSR